jgi:PAS domain S-box-containing protein
MAAVNFTGSYNYALVALSVLIAIFASYAALDLAGRVTAARGWIRAVWLLGGAGAMGTGIWSMHYIGMLAFILPIPVAYHWPTVLLSLFAAILASVIALYVVSRQKMGAFRALAGSVLMGIGIASMHYIGMAAMRLPAVCEFNSFLVVLSVVFAVLISLAALSITFHFRDGKTGSGWKKTAGAIVMGAAIPVMHYTGMAAASFRPSAVTADLTHAVSISTLGTAGIAAVTLTVLWLALLTSWVDRQFALRTLELQKEKLHRSEAYLAEAQRLSRTGSFGWNVSTGQIIWSEETFRIFQYDRTTTPTLELILQRVHPEDAARVKHTIERASQDRQDFEHEYRLVMPDGSIKYLHVLARALETLSSDFEYVGAVMDVTAAQRTEETLRDREACLAEAQRLSHTGSWARVSATGEMRYWSEECYRMLGFDPRGELPRFEAFLQRVHPDDQARIRKIVDTATREKVAYQVDYRIVHPGGNIRDIHTVGHPVFSPSGELVEFVGTVMDVTERKQGEALRDGESRILEMIARDAPLDQTLEKLVNVVEAQFSGLLCSVLLLDEDGQHVRHGAAPSLPEAYNKAIDGLSIGPQAGPCGTAMYRKQPVVVTDILEDPLWAPYRRVAEPYGLRACWSNPILAHSGRALGSFAMYYREPRSPSPAETRSLEMATHLAGIAIERKLTQERLQRGEAYLAEAQRLSHTGSWAFNAREAVYWSEENFRIWGFNPRNGLPDREAVVQRIHPEDRDRVVECVRNAIRERTDYAVDFRIVLPDEGVRYLHGTGQPVFSTRGEIVEIVGTSVDVTERKRAEEERERLRQAQADLAHINRVTTMGELTASLAHEIKQPITAAVTNARTCLRWLERDTPDVAEARGAASRLVSDVTRASDIISRISFLFKKGAQQHELVDVNELVREMVALLRSEAARYSISIRCDLAEDLPMAMADRIQLQQVFMNLMLNGIDAMNDNGCCGSELTITTERMKNGHLLISVSDTGVGLPQKPEEIFSAFFTTKPQGTGMGLPISRSIIESHGGRLWADSNSGRGASFHFTLPAEVESRHAGASRGTPLSA